MEQLDTSQELLRTAAPRARCSTAIFPQHRIFRVLAKWAENQNILQKIRYFYITIK